ncbi:MAG: hypothetical protein ACOYM3_29515, partial [Terrimicrobiaceae bacterium]
MSSNSNRSLSATVLYVSPVKWSGLMQRHQAFASCFAALGVETIFVNPLQTGGFGFDRQKVSDNISVVTIWVPFRAANWPPLMRMSCRVAVFHMKHCKIWNPAESFLWIADPVMADWCLYPWKNTGYDRCDRHGYFRGQRRPAYMSYERRILEKASVVIGSSPILLSDLEMNQSSDLNKARRPVEAYIVPNACSASWLKSSVAALPSAKPLKLVSCGAHFEWTDMAWLELLSSLPDAQLHVVGPGRGSAFERLIKRQGVIYHGIVEHSKLPAILDTCHVGLLPFIPS